jgi:hypothetical protein
MIPPKPKVWKYNPITQGPAAAVLAYLDDFRALGLSQAECWRVMHRVATSLTALGIQVASRKTRAPTTKPGPWAGMVAWVDETRVCFRSTQTKWTKARAQLEVLREELEHYKAGNIQALDFKRLRSTRGFLVHMHSLTWYSPLISKACI